MTNIFDLFKQIEKKEEPSSISAIVVGLGNPGAEYAQTRHNAGYIAIDYIAEKLGVKIDRVKFSSLVTEANIGGVRVLLMKPTTYMNNSGRAVREAMSFYKISPERVVILHDEISFAPGNIRIRRKGSAGGHNGLKSLISEMASDGFPRIKIGVGEKPRPDYDLADWVLGVMPKEARGEIDRRLPDIYDAVSLIISSKIDEAMQRYSK